MKNILWTMLTAILLMGAAFINGYPLITADTGTYIWYGWDLMVPMDRPIFYGIFLRHSSLAVSFWFTIFFQSLILSYLIWLSLNEFANTIVGKTAKLFIVFFLVLFTGISWYSSQLMPDTFTSIGLLAFALLLLTNGSTTKNILISIIFIGSSLMHSSHLVIYSLLIMVVFVFILITKSFQKKIITKTKFIQIVALIIGSWFLAPAVNYFIDGKYRMTGSPHAFLMAKYVESGIIDRYLEDHCDEQLPEILPDSGLYYICAKHSEKFLDVEGASKKTGVEIHQWDFNANENQQFNIVKVNKEYFKIVSKNSGKCLEVSEKDTVYNGSRIIQNEYLGKDNQLFSFKKSFKYCHFIQNKKSKKFIDIRGISKENGALANEWEFTGADNQQFKIIKYPNCLCLYKDELPDKATAFLWAGENNIFQKTGEWVKSKDEYNSIIKQLFSPRYILTTFGDAFVYTCQQLLRIDIGDGLWAFDEKSSNYKEIKKFMPFEKKSFSSSRQNHWALNFTEINKRHFWLMIFSLTTIVCFLRISKLRTSVSDRFIVFIFISISAVVCNAFVTGALANVLDRLQCRIVWIIPMIAILLILNYAVPMIKKI